MNSSESAEAVVKMSLEGTEVAVKILGSGAIKIAAFLLALSKEKKMTRGKTKITNMIKSGKPLNIFSLKAEDLKKFKEEAKRYAIPYALIANKKQTSQDGMVDILAMQDDAKRIDQIFKRFKLSTVDISSIKSEIEKDKIDKMVKEAKEQGFEPKSKEEKLVDEILIKPIKKEENEIPLPKSHQSENLSGNKETMETFKMPKPSVRKTLKEIKKEQDEKTLEKEKTLSKNKEHKVTNISKTKKKIKRKKEKGR